MESNQKKVSECSPDDRFTVDGKEGVWAMSVPNVCGVSWVYRADSDMEGWWIPADDIVTVIAVDVSDKPTIPAWGEVEKEAWTSEPIGIDVVMTLADGSKQVTHIPIEQHTKSQPIVYQSLEEILQDMIEQKRPLTIMSKLQNTINKGYYINTRPTE